MTRTSLGLLPVLLAAAALSGCDPWGKMPHQTDGTLDGNTWNDTLVAATDGLYVALPHAGDLIRVKTDGSFETVDLDGASPVASYATPDASSVLTFAEWPICLDEDPDITTVSDCPDDKIEWGSELDVIADGEVQGTADAETYFNRMVFSPTIEGAEQFAVAYLDYQGGDIDVNGSLNLGDVLFINLATKEITSVNIGYSPNRVLFSVDGSRTVVLSRNHATVLDSATTALVVDYPLGQDVDQDIDPSGAIITPDGRNLLISVADRTELYSLDMEVESINIITLSASPAAMATDSITERAVVVYQWSAQADVLVRQPNYYNDFEIESIALDEPCTAIEETDAGFAVLYNVTSATHDVYLLDMDTTELTEFRVANPLISLQLTPDKAYAVGIGQPEPWAGNTGIDALYDQNWTLSLIDLVQEEERDLVLEAAPVGLAFSGEGAETVALLLLQDQEYLLQVNVQSGESTEITLPEPPTTIGSMADPTYDFYITHDSALGLISFLDTANPDNLAQASGFAVSNLMGDDELPRTSAK